MKSLRASVVLASLARIASAFSIPQPGESLPVSSPALTGAPGSGGAPGRLAAPGLDPTSGWRTIPVMCTRYGFEYQEERDKRERA